MYQHYFGVLEHFNIIMLAKVALYMHNLLKKLGDGGVGSMQNNSHGVTTALLRFGVVRKSFSKATLIWVGFHETSGTRVLVRTFPNRKVMIVPVRQVWY